MRRWQTNCRNGKRHWLPRLTLGIVLWLWLTVFVLMLVGCASRPIEQVRVSVPCPPPVALPKAVSESSSPDASDYSARVSSWLAKVRDFLSELQPTKMSQE